MGKSSPTKLQLKHIPDQVVLETVFFLSHMWSVWMGGYEDRTDGNRRMSFKRQRTAHLDEIAEVLRPLPKKLVWRKLQRLEDRGLIESFGPSSSHFRVVDE